jgi:hypothetical protein
VLAGRVVLAGSRCNRWLSIDGNRPADAGRSPGTRQVPRYFDVPDHRIALYTLIDAELFALPRD